MQTDFTPEHLKHANESLDQLLLDIEDKDDRFKDLNVKKTLWQRFLGLFRSNPFELPEDLYKLK